MNASFNSVKFAALTCLLIGLISHNTNTPAIEPCETYHDVSGIVGHDLKEISFIHYLHVRIDTLSVYMYHCIAESYSVAIYMYNVMYMSCEIWAHPTELPW